jgi:hypothetical protein
LGIAFLFTELPTRHPLGISVNRGNPPPVGASSSEEGVCGPVDVVSTPGTSGERFTGNSNLGYRG